MATRPNIKLLPNVDNDVYALLNAQAGYPAVTVGDSLRIQNKGSLPVYIHEDTASAEKDGGTSLPQYWQATTRQGAPGVIATCLVFDGVINVEVV